MVKPIPYFLAWLCLIHLTLFAVVLFLKKDNRAANRVLGLFMLILAYIHFTHILLFENLIARLHWFNEFGFLLLYLEGPLFLLYTSYMTGLPVDWKRRAWSHALPFIAPALYIISFLFRDTASIERYYAGVMEKEPADATALLALVTAQMAVYMIWSLRLLYQYNKRIQDKAYNAIMSLKWLYILTLVLLFFSVAGVPLMLVFIPSDISVLFIYMPVITLIIYLTLFYKSINFPGTAYEKKLIRAEEREKISRDMHDEIGSGITHIALLSEIARKSPGVNPGQLDEISGNARRLAENLREIVWGLNSGDDTLDSMLARMRRYIADYLEAAGISYTIMFPADIPDIEVSYELRRNLMLVLKEALHNIVRHSGADKAEVSVTLLNDRFSLRISDNGMSPELPETPKGNGLRNMKKRTELIGGRFSVSMEQGKGTSLFFEDIRL